MIQEVTEGTLVRLNVPENPRLHDQAAVVVSVTEYGAVVQTPAAATGEFRALFEEMEPYSPAPVVEAKSIGYTGNVCAICGSARMRRNGTCELCEECGSTSGCS